MENYIEKHLEDIKNDLREVVKFNSELASDGGPFGKENQKVLDTALKQLKEKGLKTKNLDYYCGYGEIGEGDKRVDIIAHLDIVPVGDGWSFNPLELTEKDGYLYGRGVSDDKGAGIAASWAIKYLIDTGYKFKKRFRLVWGCNEETGSLCMKHYTEKEGNPDMGFTPDGEFPGIYAEKGMLGGLIIGHNSKIKNIESLGATNIVSKKCVIELEDGSFDLNVLDAFLKENNIKYEYANGTLTVYGKAAHASIPEDGVNAINYAMVALHKAGFKDSYVDFFNKFIGLDLHGESLGFEDLKDSESNTSINLGIAKKEGNDVMISLDMRFPVKTTSDKCVALMNKMKDDENEFVLKGSLHEPLYFDINSPFIKALDKAYRSVTNDNKSKMEAIGGGTYAKHVKNIIAFGCAFPGEVNNIHGADEHLSIESLKKQIAIYIEAIKNLNEVE